MEKWIEVYEGVIPTGEYLAEIITGDENGVMICLESKDNLIKIDFGTLSAIRILDEGVVLQELYNELEFIKFQKHKFANTIYKIEGGDFGKFIKECSGETYYDLTNFEHYLIITLNYFIEVVSQWEPEIDIIHS